ncbi:hypothetical protein BT93_C0496 [Corymbia citriodora subsp. variegata]|nr:hypothetical protein BT93_C0496 [Corymbia citriodora subsp. variegata]
MGPSLELKKNDHSKVPVWIRLRHIPFALWSARGISGIASIIGNSLYVDQNTEHMKLLSYAHVCVEISATDIRRDKVVVRLKGVSRTVNVEYGWRPILCLHSGAFGYRCSPQDTSSALAVSTPVYEVLAANSGPPPSILATCVSPGCWTASDDRFPYSSCPSYC